MDIYEDIRQRLKKYSNVVINEEPHGLSVTTENGFTVWIASNDEYYSVGFDGWDDEFNEADEAKNCFAWCLSESCRLKIYSKGARPFKWVVQSYENGEWIDMFTTGSLFCAFWRKTTIEYKQNILKRS